MSNIWISPSFLDRFISWRKQQGAKDDADTALGEMLKAAIEPRKSGIANLPDISTAFALSNRIEWKASYLDVAQSVLLFDFRDKEDFAERPAPSNTRALLLPRNVAEQWVDKSSMWRSYCKGICDVADIDRAKKRTGTSFKAHGIVSSIFLSVDNRRVHFVDKPNDMLAVLLGDYDSLLWQSHSQVEHNIEQPRGTQVEAWTTAHRKARQRYDMHMERLSWVSTPQVPEPHLDEIPETWVSKEQLEEIGITEPRQVRAVMNCRIESDDDFLQLVDTLSEQQWVLVDVIRNRRQARENRQNGKAFGLIAQYELSCSEFRSGSRDSYTNWLSILTPIQREVVLAPKARPIRLKGGPGTGKTLTSILRAAELLYQAEREDEPYKIGVFVFNRDLGIKIFELAIDLGLDKFLDEQSRQRLVITSLGEWCEDFLNVGNLGIEPLAAYRADRFEKSRQAIIELTIEEARKELKGEKYERLWRMFDFGTRNGLREVDTEISQFIKARSVATLDAYLKERKPAQWLEGSDQEFRSFVWQVYRQYDDLLKRLKIVDADDLVNDSYRRVSQTIWQNFEKDQQGFDYLIIDEAHDFFRHHLHLLAGIVKNESNMLMAFDEGQTVYSRYPTLREMGYESNEKFLSKKLEVNFRSSKQIVHALQSLTSAYPMYDYGSMWGQISANPLSPDGPLPESQGFQTDTGMRKAVGKLIRLYVGKDIAPKDIAVIAFSEDELIETEKTLQQSFDFRTHRLTGEGRRSSKEAITVSLAHQVKGEQFAVCILVGVDRDRLPDFSASHTEMWNSQKKEDDFRLFAVAMSRCKTYLHFLWYGAEPCEFVEKMGSCVKHRG